MEYDLEKISNNIERKNALKKTLKKIFFTFLIIIAIINIIFLYNTSKGVESPSIFGIYFFNIVSGSMSPTLEINDVILVKKTNVEKLKIDDIITFTVDGKIISHRIVKVLDRTNEKAFLTKGDNNEIVDEGYVNKEQIYGKVIFHIPKIGEIVKYIQNKNGFINIISLVIISFILISMKDEKKNKRKRIRQKYEIKKEREKYN